MADYGVNIAVAVKNTQAITKLSRDTDLLGQKIRNVNDALEKFGNLNGKTVVNSVANFNKELAKAAENFNDVRLGSDRAADAARNFARAQDLANDALREQAALLAEVRNQGRSGTLRGGTQYGGPIGPGQASATALSSPLPPRSRFFGGRQYSGPIGPGPVSATALSSPLPPSVPVALRSAMRPQSLLPQMGMTAQAGKIASDMEDVYASILRLTEKANQEEAEKLQTLRQGTREVEELAKKYRVVNEAQKTGKQLQLEIRRNILETKQAAAEEARIASRDYLKRLENVEKIGKERRDQMYLADRELATERKINEVLERKARKQEKATEQAQRRKQAVGSALIGGAFPLLFGQGVGAAAGGAAGGFGGGMIGGEFGFGLSLIGTQVGTLIDQFVAGATELGQALNPLTADIDALTTAAGLAATETQKFIKQIEEEAGEKAALAAATSELALIVGTDGVTALTEFGDGSLELSRQFSIAMTQMQSVLAKFLNSIGLGRGLAGAVERTNLLRAGLANTTDPELLRLQKERRQALTGAAGAVAGAATIGIDKEIVERQRELQKENSEEIKEQARLAAQNNDQALRQAGILRDRLTIEKLGGSLLDDRVYGLERSIILQQAALKAADDELTPLEQANIFRERDVELQQLANRRQAKSEKVAARKVKLSEKEEKTVKRRIDAVDREIKSTTEAFIRAESQLDDIINKNKDKVAFEKEYARLIQQGSTPAAAKQAIELQKQLLQLDRTYDKLIERLDVEVLSLKASIEKAKAEGATEEALKGQIAALEEIERKIAGLEGKKEGAEGAISEALAPKSDRQRLLEYMDDLQGKINDMMDPVRQLTALSETLGSAFSESFKGLITGSMSAREALANLFQRTADHFLDMATRMIAAQLQMQLLNIALPFFGGIPASGSANPFPGHPTHDKVPIPALPPLPRALGGAVGAGRPYMVGERGPELFVPGAQGNIVPNNAMGGANVTVNVDASGSSVEGDADQASQLGKAIGIAVQQELVKQKRPGGLLAR